MPLKPNLHKILLIGSGPIVIGQAAEFDYAGAQACRALKEEGLEVVLVNSNPATIMTDSTMADHIYMEPLTPEFLKKIIQKENPQGILATMGGQTGLTLSMQLYREGFLQKEGTCLLGSNPEAIARAENRQTFKETMEAIGEPVIPSTVATTLEGALSFSHTAGYPVIIRPAFTLGGAGGGIAEDETALRKIAARGLRLSPINQILVEKCVTGWKEIEFEVIRDNAGNAVAVCSMENLDPVGIHTGDSIVVAPTLTLADREFQQLRGSALHIIEAMGIEGGCNVQFALHPKSLAYAVIEVNPRVSRSSALASKATGYPIARVAAKIAIGYRLDEITNEITQKTTAFFEPSLDYVVVKFPKFPFDKFVYASRSLGTQMKATGEVMAIGRNFEQALMKAVRGAEISRDCLAHPALRALDSETLLTKLSQHDDERIFVLYEALYRGVSIESLHALTAIDKWFLAKIFHLCQLEKRLAREQLTPSFLQILKQNGFLDTTISRLSGKAKVPHMPSGYKMVDTCSAEFEAATPYFYASFGEEDEAAPFRNAHPTQKQVAVVLGSGPIRIGQGIEFDYACVHCVRTLREAGYETVMINNNPETVSTDFNTADRLYFEPLTPEDIGDILEIEKPAGVVVAFGGQTAIRLTKWLSDHHIPLLGTSADSIDRAEDRGRFEALLKELGIPQPEGDTVRDLPTALKTARRLGYPVLLRPSYVLGGQNMIIAYSDDDVKEYMQIILSHLDNHTILIDKYMMGTELEVDAICDGQDVLLPGIMEHIDRAGIHSGDSIAVYPPWNLSPAQRDRLIDYSTRLALSLHIKGLVNIQYVISRNEIYVIEVNPRSSRTVPYLSKVTGIPMADIATRVMLGEKLQNMPYGTGLYPPAAHIAVKAPVFSFEKLSGLDNQLGPEMKSTGEALGLAPTMPEALYKALLASGYQFKTDGGILFTVRDTDKEESVDIAGRFAALGFHLYATEGTAAILRSHGIHATLVHKINESMHNTISLLESGRISYVLSTSQKGRTPARDSVKVRRKAIELGIICLTSLDTAAALADILKANFTPGSCSVIDICSVN